MRQTKLLFLIVFAKKSAPPLRISPPPPDEETNLPSTKFNFDGNKSETSSTGTDSPNLVKKTICAIQLKAVPEVLEGNAPGSKEVLDMIDVLFDNFFESQKTSETRAEGEKSSGQLKKKNPSKGKVPKIQSDSKTARSKKENIGR